MYVCMCVNARVCVCVCVCECMCVSMSMSYVVYIVCVQYNRPEGSSKCLSAYVGRNRMHRAQISRVSLALLP